MGYHIITPNSVEPIGVPTIHVNQPSIQQVGSLPVPIIVSVSPNPVAQTATLTITVAYMPNGFTLNSITVGGTSLNSPTKVNETTITGEVDVAHPIAADQAIVITYNTSSTLTSATILVEVTA